MFEISNATKARRIAANLQQKIGSRSARVGIVRPPVAVEFARAGFEVTGVDVSPTNTDRVDIGESYVSDVPGGILKLQGESGKLRSTSEGLEALRIVEDLDV